MTRSTVHGEPACGQAQLGIDESAASRLTGGPEASAPRLVAEPDDERNAIHRERRRRFREQVPARRDERSTRSGQ
jgi:hypothetical protein